MPTNEVAITKFGRFRVACPNCERVTVRKYSDDHVWCRACMLLCADTLHEPDDDDKNTCFRCGWNIRAGKVKRGPGRPQGSGNKEKADGNI